MHSRDEDHQPAEAVGAPPGSAVRCHDVRKVYGRGDGRVVALAGVDLDVAAGEFVVLLGASGSGKSTLLHLSGCLEAPTSGRILVDGRDVTSLADVEAARHRRSNVGFVFQRFNLVPTLSALDNVALPARLAGTKVSVARERAEELLDRVGLRSRRHAAPSELSGGQQQRVALARALVNAPPLLLADEPTGNLDRTTGEQVVALLEEVVRERGTTLIMATHAEDLARRASRVLELEDGRRVDPGAAA